jgi:hypothetical protein
VWSEDAVRYMVVQAGLSDVQMSYASSSGDSRLIATAKRSASTFGGSSDLTGQLGSRALTQDARDLVIMAVVKDSF